MGIRSGVPGARSKSQGRGTRAAGMILRAIISNCRWPVVIRYHQVAAHTTPKPLSCSLIVLNSNSRNWEMYRIKGRISRTPLLMAAIAVRKFMTVFDIDCAFCVLAVRIMHGDT